MLGNKLCSAVGFVEFSQSNRENQAKKRLVIWRVYKLLTLCDSYMGVLSINEMDGKNSSSL